MKYSNNEERELAISAFEEEEEVSLTEFEKTNLFPPAPFDSELSGIIFVNYNNDETLDKRRRDTLASIIANTSPQIANAMPDNMKSQSSVVDAKLCNAIQNISPGYLVDELYMMIGIEIRSKMTKNRIFINGLKEDC